MALQNYEDHLKDLQKKDMIAMKKQIQEMKRMKTDLEGDLDQENTQEAALLQAKDDLADQVEPRVMELRRECEVLMQEIEETKNNYDDVEVDMHDDDDTIEVSDSQANEDGDD